MFLKSIKLSNIRSYESQELNFPAGSTLLAGDIGSGKSTILLAIEFALFGAKKGELPAYTLLRHGSKEGSVELKFEVDKKEHIIKRTLKRVNNDIRQDAGFIISNGSKLIATSEELRAITLEILGYPKDLVKKGKDLIYRYTVYTPQESMRQILYDSNEARLDTLRKVFNFDKYRRIKDNSKILVNEIRENKKQIEGFIMDLGYKKKELEERKNEIIGFDKMINELNPKIDEIKSRINSKKESIQNIEGEIKQLNRMKNELSSTESALKLKIEYYNRLNEEIRKLDESISAMKKELDDKGTISIEETAARIKNTENEISACDRKQKEIAREIRELEVKMEQCHETIRRINLIERCTLCEQKVEMHHKISINQRETKNHGELLERLNEKRKEESQLEMQRDSLKKDFESLLKEEKHLNLLKMKSANLDDKEKSRQEKIHLKESTKKDIGALNAGKSELNEKLKKFEETEETYSIVRKEIDSLLPQERFLELEKRKHESQRESTIRFIVSIEKEIFEKHKSKERLNEINNLLNWIEEFFISLMGNIERHVMSSIHSQFNELFQKWFDILIEDETINVRIDESFTPVIEQNGYETFVENLSGGEKTSVALAYRLALNKVVNDIAFGIKTNDLIMLDEPTDGFSAEQLDKVRDVLEQLNMNQIIIVSHEAKIESFVQNVIRIGKQDNVSVIE